MKSFALVGLAILILGCHQSESEVISIEEVLPKANELDTALLKQDSVTKFPSIYRDLSTESQGIILTLGLDTASIEPITNRLFVDRFASEKVEKWQGVDTSGNLIKGAIWTYADSTQARNAFFNWLDCFGPRCLSLKLNESKHLVDASFLWVLGKQQMIFIQGIDRATVVKSNAPLNAWITDNPWQFSVTQTVKGKCKWLTKNPESGKVEIIDSQSQPTNSQ